MLKHDTKKLFRFSSLQSDFGKSILTEFALPTENFNSFVLIRNGKAYTKSTAALFAAQMLSGPVKLLYGFIIVPAFIRNAVYSLIANNRYKWFGKRESCMLPSPDIAARFLN